MGADLLQLPKLSEFLIKTNSSISLSASHSCVKSESHLDSPAQVLHRLIGEKISGRLIISDPQDIDVSWQIWMGNGQIHFATSLVGQFDRLSYFQQFVGFTLPATPIQKLDYLFLCAQWQSGRLSLGELRTALTLITQDALIQILKLPQAIIRFEPKLGLDPLLISEPIQKLLSPVLPTLRRWQKVQPEILSPLQRPIIKDRDRFNQLRRKSEHSFSRMLFSGSFLEREYCLYQVAQHMRVSVSQLIPVIKNLVQQGLIEMHPYLRSKVQPRPTVACVDADLHIQEIIQKSLQPQGYDVLALTEPAYVWPWLTRYQPDLLLLDVDHFDGHRFLRILLRSEQFKKMPIVTLTERANGVHQFWARRSGATDCWIKPFEASRLHKLVQKINLSRCVVG